jgi:hypothetical protein
MAVAPRSLATVRTVEDLDAGWLQAALDSGPVSSFETEQIGTGQMSSSHRVRLRFADGGAPATAVLKVAASDFTSRATGLGLGIYEREVRFYR